jgi:hypothetical protein
LCNYFEDGTRISANSDKCFAEEIGRKTTDSTEKITFKEKPFHIRRYRRAVLK